MRQCGTRDRIAAYVATKPKATVREIMVSCGVSSTSVVAHHLKTIRRNCCPVCKGMGSLPPPASGVRDEVKERRDMARVLRNNGYSLRQIQKFIGWKSVGSVQKALED